MIQHVDLQQLSSFGQFLSQRHICLAGELNYGAVQSEVWQHVNKEAVLMGGAFDNAGRRSKGEIVHAAGSLTSHQPHEDMLAAEFNSQRCWKGK
jgi:hypothetical protein